MAAAARISNRIASLGELYTRVPVWFSSMLEIQQSACLVFNIVPVRFSAECLSGFQTTNHYVLSTMFLITIFKTLARGKPPSRFCFSKIVVDS
jgi:hypothetical protein